MQSHDAARLYPQRISLARACYAGADVYLLDDPLSAVDSHVARHLFEQCIVGALSGSSRVLVTHKLELLPHADHVVVMRDGRAVFQGTYKELLSSGLDLTALLPKEEEFIRLGNIACGAPRHCTASRRASRRASHPMPNLISSKP